MIPAHADIAVFVETCAESDFHVVGNETAARSHERTVAEFPAAFLVPEYDIGKSEYLVIKKNYRSDIRANIEEEHQRTLDAEICNYCG